MKFGEALREAQENGKKIRLGDWSAESYAFWEGGQLKDDFWTGAEWDWGELAAATNWEIFEEPAKDITWYRATAKWHSAAGCWTTMPSDSDCWYKSEHDAQAACGDWSVIIETMEAPDYAE